MFKLLLSLALVAVAIAGPFNKVPKVHAGGRIIGGVEARIEDYPYQVSFRSDGSHMCGASILDATTILTAAHCTDGENASDLSIMVGSNNVNEGDIYQVASYTQHSEYNSTTKDYDYDIAILKLSSSIVFGNKVAIIALQAQDVEVAVGSEGRISGWGDIVVGAEETPTILRKTEVDIISHDDCQKSYPKNSITDRMLCAKRAGQESCQGDSGGPLVVGNIQVGIVSWAIGCANPRYPGVYSKVSNLRSWIETNR